MAAAATVTQTSFECMCLFVLVAILRRYDVYSRTDLLHFADIGRILQGLFSARAVYDVRDSAVYAGAYI